jgi:hypothetical protein
VAAPASSIEPKQEKFHQIPIANSISTGFSGLPFKNGIYFEPPVPNKPFTFFSQPFQVASFDDIHMGKVEKVQSPHPLIHSNQAQPAPDAIGHIFDPDQQENADSLVQSNALVTPSNINLHPTIPHNSFSSPAMSSLQQSPSPQPPIVGSYRPPIYPNRQAAPSTEPDYSNYDSSRPGPPLLLNDVPVFVPLPRKPFLPSSSLDLDTFKVAKEIRHKSQLLDVRPEKTLSVSSEDDPHKKGLGHLPEQDKFNDPHDQIQGHQGIPLPLDGQTLQKLQEPSKPVIVKALLPPPPTQKVHHFHYHFIPTPIPLHVETNHNHFLFSETTLAPPSPLPDESPIADGLPLIHDLQDDLNSLPQPLPDDPGEFPQHVHLPPSTVPLHVHPPPYTETTLAPQSVSTLAPRSRHRESPTPGSILPLHSGSNQIVLNFPTTSSILHFTTTICF